MINLNNTNLLGMGRNEVLELAKRELEDYKEARLCNSVTNNIRQIKVLEAVNNRLGVFSCGDTEVINTRGEINTLLNEDVYRRPNPKEAITTYSSREAYIKAKLNSR